MGPLGMGEIVVLFILALLIFGPKKLPELGRTFGKGMAEFKRASSELKTTFRREMDTIEQETKDVKNLTRDVERDIGSTYNDQPDDYYSDYDYGEDASSGASGGTDPSTASAAEEEAGTPAGEDADPTAAAPDAGSADEVPEYAGGLPDSSGEPESEPVSGVPESEQVAASKPA